MAKAGQDKVCPAGMIDPRLGVNFFREKLLSWHQLPSIGQQ
jgi:hypothetical protein